MSKKPTSSDPLGPIEAITSVLTILLLTLVGFVAIAVATGNTSLSGADQICRTPNFSMINGEVGSASKTDAVSQETFGLGDGVTLGDGRTEMCQNDPSVAQQLLDGLTSAPTGLVFIGFLILTRRTIKYARHNGLFSASLAEQIEALGWLLVLGLVGAAIIEWLADGLLKHSMASTMPWHSGSFSISVAAVIGAYGIITVGRVMSHAAALQEDADATI